LGELTVAEHHTGSKQTTCLKAVRIRFSSRKKTK
jgi:hypothetical protein